MKKYIYLLLIYSWSLPVTAQIILDGTLGPAQALTAPDYHIGADLGQQRGNNLFHSFSQFNLAAHESATFSGPPQIERIINRVTGGQPSYLAGLLNVTIPNADIYLLNPEGIVFGDNAQLNINGSFYASTADTLEFADGNTFNARWPDQSTLTAAPATAFGFLSDTAAGITLDNSILTLPTGEALGFAANTITLRDSQINSVGNSTEHHTTLIMRSNALTLDNSQLTSSSTATTAGGHININTQQLQLHNNGQIISRTDSSYAAGDIQIQADKVTLTDNDSAQTTELPLVDGVRPRPDAAIDTDLIETIEDRRTGAPIESRFAQESSGILITNYGDGNAGTITIAAQHIIVSNAATINASTIGQGNAGSLNLTAERLDIENGGLVGAVTLDSGNAGNVNIQADHIYVSSRIADEPSGDNLSGIIVGSLSEGKAGEIKITAEQLWLDNGALIGANNSADGAAGNISLTVDETLRLSGNNPLNGSSGIQAVSAGRGRSGSIQIAAGELWVEQGGEISASSRGTGKAGNLTVQVVGDVYLSGLDAAGSGSTIGAQALGEGNAGTLTLTAQNLFLDDGAVMGVFSAGSGNAGNVNIEVADTIDMRGLDSTNQVSLIQASALGNGNAGVLSLQANQLVLREGAAVLGLAAGTGKAGDVNIDVNTADIAGRSPVIASIEIDGVDTELNPASGLYAGTGGDGGTIRLQANQLRLSDSAIISTSALRDGIGGEIFIHAGLMVMDEASIVANSSGNGNAGNVAIDVMDTIILRNSLISTNSLFTDGGNIRISSDSYLRMIDSAIDTTINAPDGSDGNIELNNQFIILANSEIIAQTASGEAGAIDIATEGLFVFPPVSSSEIRATSDLTIRVDTESENPDQNILLPIAFLDSTTLLLDPCSSPERSRFTLTEYGGVGYQPDDLQNAGLALGLLRQATQRIAGYVQTAEQPPAALWSGFDAECW